MTDQEKEHCDGCELLKHKSYQADYYTEELEAVNELKSKLVERVYELEKELKELTERVKQQAEQIEKMKCCGNCINRMHEIVYDDLIECKYGLNDSYQKNCDKWELTK